MQKKAKNIVLSITNRVHFKIRNLGN